MGRTDIRSSDKNRGEGEDKIEGKK